MVGLSKISLIGRFSLSVFVRRYIFHIRIKKGLNTEDLLTAIFHEFVHIKQHIRKEYDLFSIHDENGKLAYLDRPYEIEAFKMQEELLEKFST